MPPLCSAGLRHTKPNTVTAENAQPSRAAADREASASSACSGVMRAVGDGLLGGQTVDVGVRQQVLGEDQGRRADVGIDVRPAAIA